MKHPLRNVILLVSGSALFVALRTRQGKDKLSSAIKRGTMLTRNTELVRLGAKVGATYASASARKVFSSAERRVEIDHQTELKTAAQVSERLGNMKGALMKLGQMASYLDDGLPAPMRA